jgi:hypothetical protein
MDLFLCQQLAAICAPDSCIQKPLNNAGGTVARKSRGDEQAQPDELERPGETGPESAGQSGDQQQLSSIEDAENESVQELAEEDQPLEASVLEGVEDAADHPERPTHTHNEYGRPEDLPPQRKRSA